MLELFPIGKKMQLHIEVKDSVKAEELMAWLNPRLAKDPKDYFGCELTKIGWDDKEAFLMELLQPIKEAIKRGDL